MGRITEEQLISYCNYDGTEINLRNTLITDADIFEIISFINKNPFIKTVDLSSNQIGPEGVKIFAQFNKTATTVDLNWNQIGALGAKYFAQFNKIAATVYLGYNQIGDAGAKDFAQLNTTTTTVYLDYNQIGDAGVKDFAQFNTTVTKASLIWNLISDKGAKDFFQFNKTITSLDLSYNEIGDEGIKVLVSNGNLQNIDASGNKFSPAGNIVLKEKNPIKRANYGRDVNLTTVPSLLRLSLFAVKEDIIKRNYGQVRTISCDDLGGLADKVELINQNLI